jgi:DNA-binding FrmR family transcriptional regulator
MGYIFSMNEQTSQVNIIEPEVLTPERHSTSYADDKAKILTRLRRIEGQVRGVQRMVEDDKYCVDILTQLSAIIAGARATGLLVLEDHIRGCVVNAAPEEREAALAELMTAIERFNRSVS